MKQIISLAFSPCPNDTFIFDALVNQKIDTEGLSFEVALSDVQTLNQEAIAGKHDISKISYAVLPLLLGHYEVLNSGGALGIGVGPLLIGKEEAEVENLPEAIGSRAVAIPGEHTTAHLLFSRAFPQATNKVFMPFHEIESFVEKGLGLGVIIHENRFTYANRGLKLWANLGEIWEQTTGSALPLGGIVIRNNFDEPLKQKIDVLIRKSIEYGFQHYPLISDYVKMHSQEMSETVMQQHIDLYVNDYSLSLGREGKTAVMRLMEAYHQINSGEIADPLEIFITDPAYSG